MAVEREIIVIKGDMGSGKSTIAWGLSYQLEQMGIHAARIENSKNYKDVPPRFSVVIFDGCEPPEGVKITRRITVEKLT